MTDAQLDVRLDYIRLEKTREHIADSESYSLFLIETIALLLIEQRQARKAVTDAK